MIIGVQPYSHSSRIFQGRTAPVVKPSVVNSYKSDFVSSCKDIFAEIFPMTQKEYRALFTPPKPFRVHVKKAVALVETIPFERDVNYALEYSNPDAEKLFKQLKNAKNYQEKVRIAEEMGEYRVIDLDFEKKMQRFHDMLDKLP